MINRKYCFHFILMVVFCLPMDCLPAQDLFSGYENLFTVPKTYIIYHTSDSIQIDGKPTEKSWKKAPWSEYFVDIEGDSKPEPRQKTRFKMLWDAKYLYVYAELMETQIWATLTEHDQVVYYDNDFEIFIDPDGDTHNYFEIEVNAFATIFDLFMGKPYRNFGHALISWHSSGLKTGIDIDGVINDPSTVDNKWTVEMAIPFRDISVGNYKIVPKNGDIWRINFSRVHWDVDVIDHKYVKRIDAGANKAVEYNWVWSPQGLIDMHYPERWGYAKFSTKKPKGKSSFLLPEDEKLKNYLWLLYYKQKDFFAKENRYASDFEQLHFDIERFKELHESCILEMEVTRKQFVACLTTGAGITWQINDEGRIFKQTNKIQ